MRFLASLTPRRLAGHATIAVLVGTASVAGVAFAGSSGGRPVADKASTASASTASAPDSIVSGARTALDRLVANSTIDQAQADAIEQQVEAGSVDLSALIGAGTVNQEQMQAVADALEQVKRSAASSRGPAPRSGLLVEKKKLAEQKAKLDAEAKKDGGAAAGDP